jgi:fluoride exporter
MTAVSFLLIAVGGFTGAVGRYGVNRWARKYASERFPLGTFLVNICGSLLLGWLIASRVPGSYLLLAGTGFLGSFTTFSTLQLELLRYGMQGRWRTGLLYAAATYLSGLLAAAIGFALGQ